MERDILRFIEGITAFVLPAATALTAYWLWLRFRQRARLDHDRDLELLREENAQLRAELDARLAEIDERVDFVERRLVQESDRARLEPPSRTPNPV